MKKVFMIIAAMCMTSIMASAQTCSHHQKVT
jgi:hypothetical protein